MQARARDGAAAAEVRDEATAEPERIRMLRTRGTEASVREAEPDDPAAIGKTRFFGSKRLKPTATRSDFKKLADEVLGPLAIGRA